MKRPLLLIAVSLASGCSTPGSEAEPSLAPRAAEAIDPRIPIPDAMPAGAVEAGLATTLETLVARADAGVPMFETRKTEAVRLAAAAGPGASESWIAAEQALSLLIEQYGVTTQAAAEIDAIAAARLSSQGWIRPADQEAIVAAATRVAAISTPQAEAIERLKLRLAR